MQNTRIVTYNAFIDFLSCDLVVFCSFLDCLRIRSGEEGLKDLLPKNLLHMSHIDETWCSYTSPKEDRKTCISYVTQSLNSIDVSLFSPEISNIILRNTDKNCILKHFFTSFDFY